jgi:hypothetical protein
MNVWNLTTTEAYSIITACKSYIFDQFDVVVKVTGRYFVPALEANLASVPPDVGIIYQYSQNGEMGWQNSEIFGFSRNLVPSIFQPILDGTAEGDAMEKVIFNIHERLGVASYRLPLLPLPYPVQRGGDKMVMTELFNQAGWKPASD